MSHACGDPSCPFQRAWSAAVADLALLISGEPVPNIMRHLKVVTE